MGAIPDAFEALNPQAVNYLTRPQPVVNPETGYQLQQIMPGGKFGPGLTEWTAGQRAVRTAINGAPLAAAAAMAPSDSLQQRMLPPSAGMDRVEDPNFYRSMGAATFPRSEALDRSENVPFSVLSNSYMDRNTPSELDAYPHQVQGPQQPPVVAAAKRAIPMPPSRELQAQARAEQPSSGILSGLFNRPATTKQLFQQSQDNPDDAGAWMRAERQYAATHKDNPNFDVTKLDESGMNRGGTVGGKPDKDAALHKALEIIHHMIRSR
jgi:hypothetical protein